MGECSKCLDGKMPPKGINVCSKCGKDFTIKPFIKPDIVVVQPASENLKVIQPFYQGLYWSTGEFASTHGSMANSPKCKNYTDTIEAYIDLFRNGGLANRSLYLAAPSGYGKKVFAYTCMQMAISHSHTVAPLYDVFEVKRILDLGMVSQSKSRASLLLDYESYISSEVVFITIPSERMHWYCASIIQDLLQKRARVGLATCIISRYHVESISQGDSGEFSRFCRKPPPFNPLEVPKILTVGV